MACSEDRDVKDRALKDYSPAEEMWQPYNPQRAQAFLNWAATYLRGGWDARVAPTELRRLMVANAEKWRPKRRVVAKGRIGI